MINYLVKYKAYIYQLASRLGPQFLSLLIGVFIVRLSGRELLGQYGSAMSLIGMTFTVFSAGVYTDFLRSGDKDECGDSFKVLFLSWLLLLVPIFALATFFEMQLIGFFYLYVASLIIATARLYGIYTRFIEKDYYAVLPLTLPLVLILGLVFVFNPKCFYWLSFIYLLAWSTSIYPLIRFRKIFFSKKIEYKQVFKKLKSILFLVGTVFATQVYASSDQLMLKHYIGDDSVGLYRIGLSLTSAVFPMISILSFFFLSKAKEIILEGNIIKFRWIILQQVGLNVFVGGASALFIWVFSKKILVALYGPEGAFSTEVTKILSISVFLNLMCMVFSYSLIAINKDRLVFIGVLCSAVLNIIFNLLVIPDNGEDGAAWVSVATQAVLLVSLFIFLLFQLSKLNKNLVSKYEGIDKSK